MMKLKPCPFCESFAKSIRDTAVLAGICREDIPLTGPQLLMLCEDMRQTLKNTRATDSLLKEMAEALDDLTTRCNRAREILREGPAKGYWGILDTEAADVVLQKYHEQVGDTNAK